MSATELTSGRTDTDTHVVGEPAILYLGTPVVLVSTVDGDGHPNLAPMSSAWWLGWRCVLGLDATSKTTANLRFTGQCVLNLPSAEMVAAVDALARTTGSTPVPAHKRRRDYRHEADKFAAAGLTAQPAEAVAPPRVAECPVQLEAVVEAVHPLAQDDPAQAGSKVAVETRVRRVHLARDILLDGDPDRVDPDRWRPLVMSFQRFYGLDGGELAPSRLATIPEHLYRSADVDRARTERPVTSGRC